MKKKSRLAQSGTVFFLAGMLLIGTLVGCAPKEPQPANELTVWVDSALYDALSEIWVDYQSQYPEVALSFEVIPDPLKKPDEWNNAVSRLRNMALSGTGPDLYVLNSGVDLDCFFQDINKTMRNGVFADMRPIFEKMGVTEADFGPALLEAGRADGKQYILPLRYYLDSVITSDACRQLLGDAAFQDTASMLAAIREMMEKDGAARPFIPHHGSNTYTLNPYYYTERPLVDYDTETAEIDTPLVRDILGTAKLAQERMDREAQSGRYSAIPSSEEYIEYAQSNMFFNVFQYLRYSLAEAGVCQFLDIAPCIDAFPMEGGGSCALITAYAGIGVNSKNMDNAANMMKLLLGEKSQTGKSDFSLWMSYGLPSRKAFTSGYIQTLSRTLSAVDQYFADIGMQPSAEALNDTIIRRYIDIESQISRGVFPTPLEIDGMVWQYYSGEIDLDTCITRMQAYWNLSLSE